MSSLTQDQVALQLDSLPDWQQEGNSLVKTYQFYDFTSAIAFVTRVAFYCEALEHYPKWENSHNLLRVQIGEPEQSDIRSRDVQLAKRMESVYTSRYCDNQC